MSLGKYVYTHNEYAYTHNREKRINKVERESGWKHLSKKALVKLNNYIFLREFLTKCK